MKHLPNEDRTEPKLAIKGKYLAGFRKELPFAVAITMREQIRASLFDQGRAMQ
jgi:hypothetical protein